MRVIGTFPAGVDELHSAGGAVSAVIDAAFRQADEERAQEELGARPRSPMRSG
jgi:hypothetical protein